MGAAGSAPLPRALEIPFPGGARQFTWSELRGPRTDLLQDGIPHRTSCIGSSSAPPNPGVIQTPGKNSWLAPRRSILPRHNLGPQRCFEATDPWSRSLLDDRGGLRRSGSYATPWRSGQDACDGTGMWAPRFVALQRSRGRLFCGACYCLVREGRRCIGPLRTELDDIELEKGRQLLS